MFAFADRWFWTRFAAAEVASPLTGRSGAPVVFEDVTYTPSRNGRGGPVIDRLNLRIEAGQLLCLLGPSGCGKSTLLNLVAGLLAPSEGRVLCGEQHVREPNSDRALVFQEVALFPWLTLRQNIEFPLRVRKMAAKARHERSEELLRMIHLEGHSEAFPHELSGGMRQRGALARALATDPAVLLMDEPFAALDPHARARLQDELERLWLASRKTIVFVTHSVEEAVRLGDRVVVLGSQPGRVVADVAVDVPRPRRVPDARIAELAKLVETKLETARRTGTHKAESNDEEGIASADTRARLRGDLGARL